MPGYDPRTTPPRGGTDSRSRFAHASSPTGIGVSIPEAINLALAPILADRQAEAPSLTPEPKTIPMKRVARTTAGEYVLVDLRSIVAVPTAKPAGNGKFAKRTLVGGAAVDELLLGDDWASLHPNDVFNVFRETAEQEKFDGLALRRLNELMLLVACTRAGCPQIKPWELPL